MEIDNKPQEYELTQMEVGDYKDNYGNTWVTAAFLGVSEPVRWVVRDPSEKKVGQKYYGKITEEMSKANKPYLRFRPVLKDDAKVGMKYQTGKAYKQAADDRSDGFRQGMCFNNAANYIQASSMLEKDILKAEEWAVAVYKYATALYSQGDLKVAETDKSDEQILGMFEESA